MILVFLCLPLTVKKIFVCHSCNSTQFVFYSVKFRNLRTIVFLIFHHHCDIQCHIQLNNKAPCRYTNYKTHSLPWQFDTFHTDIVLAAVCSALIFPITSVFCVISGCICYILTEISLHTKYYVCRK